MKTRCKFYVSKITKHGWMGMAKQPPPPPQESVELSAVYGGLSEEDKSFSAATPSGTLTITVSNPAVVGTFELGAEYYIDIVPVG